jgi:hypothetical protein
MKITFLLLFFETGSLYVASAGLELEIFLPQPSTCWVYNLYHAHPAMKII